MTSAYEGHGRPADALFNDLLANLFTFGQMFLIRRTIDEDKIYKKLQENKKKPKKQSGFQKRLENAAKKYNNPPRKK